MTHVKADGSIEFMAFRYNGERRVVLNAVVKLTADNNVILVGYETKRGSERTGRVVSYRADAIETKGGEQA
jgi:hypothetical protein